MIKDIIYQNISEKENFYSKEYIPREISYFDSKFLNSDLIKIITGPRRAGKSVYAFLLLKDKKFAYLNFDDENLLKINNYDSLIEGIFSIYGKIEYLFFDEIQNLPDWEIFVNKLHRRGYNLILTGSNANLLNRELSTFLTGRYIPVEIFPFNFREYLDAKHIDYKKSLITPEDKGLILKYLNDYLQYGSYPEIVTKELDIKGYLSNLFEALLFKDVVRRYGVRYSQLLYILALYLISNFTSEYTFNKLKNSLDFRSTATLQNYLKYLEEAYIFYSLNRYSNKFKEQIKSSRKVYLIDTGYVYAKAFTFSPNYGKLMENSVFIELLRKGYKPNQDVFYYKSPNKNKEIDFVLKKGISLELLIQICYNMDNPETKTREIASLIEGSKELKCNNLLVITHDYENTEYYSGKEIKFIPLWKWLLNT